MSNLENLSALQKNPSLLIPPQLKKTSPRPEKIDTAILKIELGRLDDEYYPELSVIIFERDRGKNVEPSAATDGWDSTLESRKRHAIALQSMSPTDYPLISVIASECFREGVLIESYIQTSALRNKQVGRSFFENLEYLLQIMGYKYIFGSHNPENIGFFRKIGRYTTDQLISDFLKANQFPPTLYTNPSPGIVGVKFLDPELEKSCVKPEFLRVK